MRAVNLIPSDQRLAPKGQSSNKAAAAEGRPFGAYVILGLLAFAIAASALYVLTTNSIKENKAELAQAQQEVEVVKAQAATLQAFADFQQLSQARLETVKALAGSRFPWAATLDDIARALPADVFVNSFDGSTVTSGGGSSLRGAITAPSIQLNGCTRDQASVARLMSRLRDVRGVTRVSLSKSEAVETPETAAAAAPATAEDGSTPATTSEPCPKGAPPAFEMIVFFERAPVSPSAAPNAGTAAVAGPSGPTGPTGADGATTPASATSTTP